MKSKQIVKILTSCVFLAITTACEDFPHSNPYDPEGLSGVSVLELSRFEIVDGETIPGHVGYGDYFSMIVFLRNTGTNYARDIRVKFDNVNLVYYSGNFQREQPFEDIFPGEEGTTIGEMQGVKGESFWSWGVYEDTVIVPVMTKWNYQTSFILMDTIKIPTVE